MGGIEGRGVCTASLLGVREGNQGIDSLSIG